MKKFLKVITFILAYILKSIYGYEGLNLLLRVTPSRITISILKYFGATIGDGVRIQTPITIHNADQYKSIYKNLYIGNNSYIGRNGIIDLMDKINIGDNVTISHRFILNTHTNTGNSLLKNQHVKKSTGSIKIANGTYIGLNVVILESVEKAAFGSPFFLPRFLFGRPRTTGGQLVPTRQF